MVEIKLCYNPFKVQTHLFVMDGNEWIPIKEESGLLRVSKMRIQRWLASSGRNYFFNSLREALGEDEIIIFFSGTTEDMHDLQEAVKVYCEEHSSVNILVKPDGNTENNSSENKLKQLRDIISEAKQSKYSILLPKKTLDYLDECLFPKVPSTLLIPFVEISNNIDKLFGLGSWQMVCLTLAVEDIRTKNYRELFKCFTKQLNIIPDRSFERERFMFLCTYDSYSAQLSEMVKKLFTEYGMWDMNAIVVAREKLDDLDNPNSLIQGTDLGEAQRLVRLFKDRYADQYRLRKMHDVLRDTMLAQGYVKRSSLIRKVDEILRRTENAKNPISDSVVRKATDWIIRFNDAIDHLIEVEV